MCTVGLHCEGLFQFSAANPKLAERLRNSLDLDGANDVFTTALLLKIWLKELPEPIVWGHVASELLSTHGSELHLCIFFLSIFLSLFLLLFSSNKHAVKK